MAHVLCVRHRSGWCALKPGAKLDPAAFNDETACGYFVILRTGSMIREPTCAGCKAALKRKRGRQ